MMNENWINSLAGVREHDRIPDNIQDFAEDRVSFYIAKFFNGGKEWHRSNRHTFISDILLWEISYGKVHVDLRKLHLDPPQNTAKNYYRGLLYQTMPQLRKASDEILEGPLFFSSYMPLLTQARGQIRYTPINPPGGTV